MKELRGSYSETRARTTEEFQRLDDCINEDLFANTAIRHEASAHVVLSMSIERRLLITCASNVRVEARISDENPKTALAVWNALPIKGKVNRWGDEIYFPTTINLKEEKAHAEVEVGDLAYWPPGNAICIFFGATPASKHGEPRAYSPVNVFAKVIGDATAFKKVRDGEQITLERV